MTTTATPTLDLNELNADLSLRDLVGTLPAPKPTMPKAPHPSLSREDYTFYMQYHLELRRIRAIHGRKLTQAERIDCYMQLSTQWGREQLLTSKRLVLIGELAMYHGWPVYMVALSAGFTKYTYRGGLQKDRLYFEIDPTILEWLNA